jgi:molybdenum cofactor biosynthesis enzyme
MVDSGERTPVLVCEDLPEELPRPPLAAVRFFRVAGLKLSLKAWTHLPADVRWAIAKEGSRDVVDRHVARSLMRHIPIRHVELIGASTVPDSEPLPGVADALGAPDSWLQTTWPTLRPFHRFVLNVLRGNRRLMWRAYAEIQGVNVSRHDGWRGPLAHAEVEIRAQDPVRRELLELLVTERLLEGRALLLARASGLRVARRAGEIFDLYSELTTGAVELDWSVEIPAPSVLWQAHVSTHLGGFSPIASLAAATTAAVCLADMLKEFDPLVRVREARVVEEAWAVGKFDVEAPTTAFHGASTG